MVRMACVLVAFFAVVFVTTIAMAEEKAAPVAAAKVELVTVTGTVVVVKAEDGAVTAVSLKAGDKVTKVTLNEVGKKLAVDAGKLVEAKGTVAEGVLTVTEFKAVVKAEEKK